MNEDERGLAACDGVASGVGRCGAGACAAIMKVERGPDGRKAPGPARAPEEPIGLAAPSAPQRAS